MLILDSCRSDPPPRSLWSCSPRCWAASARPKSMESHHELQELTLLTPKAVLLYSRPQGGNPSSNSWINARDSDSNPSCSPPQPQTSHQGQEAHSLSTLCAGPYDNGANSAALSHRSITCRSDPIETHSNSHKRGLQNQLSNHTTSINSKQDTETQLEN